MRSTLHDVYQALTVRNTIIVGSILAASVMLIDVLGYLIWRRFPIPALIICVAALGWKIGRRIGHAGLSRVLNAASVGLGVFGMALFAGAVVDGTFFAERGYVSWSITMTMWAWIAFHVWRAWRVLRSLPTDKLVHVTAGTEVIYAQMTYRAAQAQGALDAYHEATKDTFAVKMRTV